MIIINNNSGDISVAQLNNDKNLFNYFAKTGDYPTLRLVICKLAILVEGHSDEMIVQYALEKEGKTLFEDGTELIVVNGTRFKNFIQLAKELKKPIAIITDNDGKSEDETSKVYDIGYPQMKVFTQIEGIQTLEPAFVYANMDKLEELAKISGYTGTGQVNEENIISYMTKSNNKTRWALNVLMSSNCEFNIPQYINDAIKWIYEQ